MSVLHSLIFVSSLTFLLFQTLSMSLFTFKAVAVLTLLSAEQLQLRSGGIEADTALPGVLIEGLAG